MIVSTACPLLQLQHYITLYVEDSLVDWLLWWERNKHYPPFKTSSRKAYYRVEMIIILTWSGNQLIAQEEEEMKAIVSSPNGKHSRFRPTLHDVLNVREQFWGYFYAIPMISLPTSFQLSIIIFCINSLEILTHILICSAFVGHRVLLLNSQRLAYNALLLI